MINKIYNTIRWIIIIGLLCLVSYISGFKTGRYDDQNNSYKEMYNKEHSYNALLHQSIYELQFINKQSYDSLANTSVALEYTKLVPKGTSVFTSPYNLNIEELGGYNNDTDTGYADDIAWY